jgi:hypothetical protein
VAASARLRSGRLVSRKNWVTTLNPQKRAVRDVSHNRFTRDEIVDLCARVHAVNEAAAEAEKVTWPPILGLFTSVVVTLTYLRRNRIQAEIGESYGVSQSTISRAVTALTPLLGTTLALVGFRKSATHAEQRLYATRSYSLISPPRTGRCAMRLWLRFAAG